MGGSSFAFPFNNPVNTCADGTHCAVLYQGTTQAGGFWLTGTTDGGTLQTHARQSGRQRPVCLSCSGASCWVSWSTETISRGGVVTDRPVVEETVNSGAAWFQVPIAPVFALQEVVSLSCPSGLGCVALARSREPRPFGAVRRSLGPISGKGDRSCILGRFLDHVGMRGPSSAPIPANTTIFEPQVLCLGSGVSRVSRSRPVYNRAESDGPDGSQDGQTPTSRP